MIRLIKNLVQACFFIAALIMLSCAKQEPSDLAKASLIPKPVSVSSSGEYFSLKPGGDIFISEDTEEMRKNAEFLANRLRISTGFKTDVVFSSRKPQSGSFVFSIDPAADLQGEEGYKLEIEKRIVKLIAKDPEGIFRGIQTIRQLLPPKIEADSIQKGPWQIPTGVITDYPVYSYRGAMIDVSRHFFGPDVIKRVIDQIAYYKMNILHLHLSDDQGWRIEIKSWPNLAAHGGSTQVGGAKGGYYTQEEYSDLVKYAQDHYITIVPEIDMPGHTNAALASYAELNSNGKASELYTGTRVGFSTLDAGKELTYRFVDDVIRELSALTPGPYFHIGGDESHATKKEDYVLFINKVQDLVEKHGKTVVGWDEIATTTLKPGSVAHFWASEENALKAVAQGARLIMSPAKKAYLDMKYHRETKLGLRWAGLIEVDTAYIWDPANYVPGIGREHILGVEAPLWTETITNTEEMDFMVFPRLPGYAEIGWTPAELRNWEDYKTRLGAHGAIFRVKGINFYPSEKINWPAVE